MTTTKTEPTKFRLQITTTPDSLDPGDTCTDVEASIAAYQEEISREVLAAYPNAEIDHYESTDHPDAPDGWRITFDDPDLVCFYGEGAEIERDVAKIMETVYETGLFWVGEK